MRQRFSISSLKAAAGRHASRRGAFSAGLTALAVAAAVLFNLLVSQLPERWTAVDLTGSGIYDISDVSRDYLSALDRDVEIHVLADVDAVDTRIVRFLALYGDLSGHLSVTYTDPVVYPSVLAKYGAEADTVVVTCADTGRQESFSIDEIIGYDIMMQYYYGVDQETDFDAEGLLTSAVDAVLTESARAVYAAAGHGEAALSDGIDSLFQKNHMSVATVNLLTDGGVPADCDLLILNGPERDLADDELDLLLDYLRQGGQVLCTLSDTQDPLPNLEALLAAYGMTMAPGIVADTGRYYQNNPYLFFPRIDTSVDAAAGLSQDATVLLYGARGLTLTVPARDTISVRSFLTTSEGGLAVSGEETQVPGTYAVGAVATEETADGRTARLTVYGSDSLISADLTDSFTNLDNERLFMASATCGFEDVTNLSIEPVSLTTPTNTIAAGGLWALLFVLVIPAALLLAGFVRWMRRRKL